MTMKSLSFAVVSLAFLAGPALADATVTVTPPPAVVVHPDNGPTVDKKVVVRHGMGCDTKSVKKTDAMGNSVTHTRTNC